MIVFITEAHLQQCVLCVVSSGTLVLPIVSESGDGVCLKPFDLFYNNTSYALKTARVAVEPLNTQAHKGNPPTHSHTFSHTHTHTHTGEGAAAADASTRNKGSSEQSRCG